MPRLNERVNAFVLLCRNTRYLRTKHTVCLRTPFSAVQGHFRSVVSGHRGSVVTAAVELSYLDKEQQAILLDVMEKEDCSPSLSQASQIKKACLEGKLDYKFLDSVLSNHKDEPVRLNLSSDILKSYFPKSYTPQQMEHVIFKLLDSWHKKRKREQQR